MSPSARLAPLVHLTAEQEKAYTRPESGTLRFCSVPAGQEYEAILAEKLRCANIAFFSEGRLRQEGFFKTPDVKLEVTRRLL